MKRTPIQRRTPLAPVNRERKAKRAEDGRVYGAYHRYVSTLPCIVAQRGGDGCSGRVEGHHVKSVGAGGEDECNEVPVCVRHHNQIHTRGPRTFEDRYGIDLDMEAANVWTRYRGLER